MTIKISELDALQVFFDDTLVPVVGNISGVLTTLNANGAILKDYITSELVTADLVLAGQIALLNGNAATQAGQINTLTANAGVQNTLITAAEANIVIANTAMKGYVDSTVTSANVVMTGYVNSTVNAANVVMTGYVNSTATTLQGNIDLLRTDFTNYSPNAAVSSYLIENPLTLEQGGTGQDLIPVAGAVMFTSNTAIELTEQGTAGQYLISNGNAAPSFATLTTGITFIIDGAGAIYSHGVKGYIQIPFNCQIVGASVLADQVGSTVIDIWKSSYETYPPLAANSICASAKPTITSDIKSTDFTLTGWTTQIDQGDILAFNVESVTAITRVTITLGIDRI